MKPVYSQGYCLNEECEDYSKGVFLQGTAGIYTCFKCRKEGIREVEKHWPDRYDTLEFSQVRLEFNFYAPEDKYLGLCVVTDTSYDKPRNVWNMKSPNIKTERMANERATNVLGFLQRADRNIFEQGIIISGRNTEIVLDFGSTPDQFKVELDALETTLRRSRLVRLG